MSLIRDIIVLVFCIMSSTLMSAEIQWLGHAAVLITSNENKKIIIDPFILKNPKTPAKYKAMVSYKDVDLILITHGHGDHVGDLKSLAALSGASVGVNADFGKTLIHEGLVKAKQIIRFNKSGTIMPIGPKIKISMVKAEHSSAIELSKNGIKHNYEGGEPAGYIIELEDGLKIYHAGDTGVFVDMQMIRDFYQPDIALLPIGGNFTMGPKEAAFAVEKYLQTPTVIPIHYGTFPKLKGTAKDFKQALKDRKYKVVVLNPGETKSFHK